MPYNFVQFIDKEKTGGKEAEALDEVIRQLVDQFPDLLGIWLYGSLAENKQTAASDLDIALLAERKLDTVALWNYAQELADIAHREVDLIDLREASTVLASQVFQFGRRVFCRDAFACDLFETVALSEYIRLNELRSEIMDDIQKRGTVYKGDG